MTHSISLVLRACKIVYVHHGSSSFSEFVISFDVITSYMALLLMAHGTLLWGWFRVWMIYMTALLRIQTRGVTTQ